MIPVANHLWQSTAFAAIVLLLALALRRNQAKARYWLWFGASIKFLLPFSLLTAIGSQFEWRAAQAIRPAQPVSVVVEQISQPFAVVGEPIAASREFPLAAALGALWFCGFAVVVTRWYLDWRRIRAAARSATPLDIAARVPVMSTRTLLEPGVFGIGRPVVLLPAGILERLRPAELAAVLAHELCHVRRRDNLAATIHMAVEAVFWFHPLVWWIGARLMEERERACDEEVLRQGSEPQVYAQGILNVCKFYLESPLACASGVTGSDLKKRVEQIMANRISQPLTFARRAMLASAAVGMIAGPVLTGTMLRAQPETKDALKYEVATIKRLADPERRGVRIGPAPGGGMRFVNVTLRDLIEFAYEVRDAQISGGPSWDNSERFEIVGKPEASDRPVEWKSKNDEHRAFLAENRERLRNLLAERFQLKLRRENKEMAAYALVSAKGGHKLKPLPESGGAGHNIRIGRGQIDAQAIEIPTLANLLSDAVERPVVDQTGLKGYFELKLEWMPEPGAGPGGDSPAASADLSGASLFTAIQEQLGLKLESKRAAVEMLVIERAEKPAEN